MNQKLDDRYNELKSQFDNKAYVNDVEEVSERLEILEAKARDRENKALMLESYEKRFNLLIHGIDENFRYAWETREQTKHLVEDFMKEGLKIEDPSKIAMADCHRLPQRIILKNKVRVNCPIIRKLTNADDKHLIFSHLKNLKIYNNTRISLNLKTQYVTQQLQEQFENERKKLLPLYKAARLEKKKHIGGRTLDTIVCMLMEKKVEAI